VTTKYYLLKNRTPTLFRVLKTEVEKDGTTRQYVYCDGLWIFSDARQDKYDIKNPMHVEKELTKPEALVELL